MVYETDDDRHDDVAFEREGTGLGTILGIILAIAVVLAIIWFFFLGGMGGGNTNTAPQEDTNITTEVNNDTDPGTNTLP
jgi:hypothetical protein